MNQSIFAFVFPFGEGGEFRCKRNFVDEHAACEWAAQLLLQGEVCFVCECESADYVFEPARGTAHCRELERGRTDVADARSTDDFDEEMEIPKG